LFRSTYFGRLNAHHQELTTALTASGFTLERGSSSVVGRGLAGRPARPRPTTLLPPHSKVKPNAVNLLKPTGYVIHHQFNIQQLFVLPTLYLCVLYLSENKQRLVPLQNKQIGFYNRDEKCLQRGTDWVFK